MIATPAPLDLTPDTIAPVLSEAEATKMDWPLPATSPAAMIPGIDDTGNLYPIEKIEAHVRRVQHQAFSVFVFSQGELLIQQRASGKYHCPNKWANTCCSHPHFNEDVKTGANRRLDEELGFRVPLKERIVADYRTDVGNGLWENERVHFFTAEVERNLIDIQPNPDEVQAIKWEQPDVLRKSIEETPHDYAPWLKIYVSHFPNLDF